jgi:hypothetical protein
VFTLHPIFVPLPFPQIFSTALLYTTLLLTINEIFLIHLFSLEREATEAETWQVCQTRFMYQALARKGNSLYKQLKQLSKSGGSCTDTLANCNRHLEHDRNRLGPSALWSDPQVNSG